MDMKLHNKYAYFNKDVIIITQTDFGLAAERDNVLGAGCDAYISKPIEKDELILLLQQYFSK